VIWDTNPIFLGPFPIPGHVVFVLVELGVLGYIGWQWYKSKEIPKNQFVWTLFAAAVIGHVYYGLKIAPSRPSFDLEIRWYGIFFAIGLLLGARAMPIYFQRWGLPRKHGEELCLWTPIGMILGAHIVHLVFYETESLLQNPFRIFEIGHGLASHGGGLGAILAVVWFARQRKIPAKDILKYMDPAMCGATWVIPWVRVGNFFNSEIVGRPWNGPWAVIFPRHECPNLLTEVGSTLQRCHDQLGHDLPSRHPSQVYEAILAFIMVGLAVYLQAKWRNRLRPGAILFILLAYYFTTRFLVEYVKELQASSDTTSIDMGQWLSIPIVLVSLYMLIFSKSSNIRTPYVPEIVPEPIEEPPAKQRTKPKMRNLDEQAPDAAAPKKKKKTVAKKKKKKKS
jgi:prolipoprotein diacylglyceryl transferase